MKKLPKRLVIGLCSLYALLLGYTQSQYSNSMKVGTNYTRIFNHMTAARSPAPFLVASKLSTVVHHRVDATLVASVYQASELTKVPVNLLLSVAIVESNLTNPSPNRVSGCCTGPFQVDYHVHRKRVWSCAKLLKKPISSPSVNVLAGAWILKGYLYHNSLFSALSQYNGATTSTARSTYYQKVAHALWQVGRLNIPTTTCRDNHGQYL